MKRSEIAAARLQVAIAKRRNTTISPEIAALAAARLVDAEKPVKRAEPASGVEELRQTVVDVAPSELIAVFPGVEEKHWFRRTPKFGHLGEEPVEVLKGDYRYWVTKAAQPTEESAVVLLKQHAREVAEVLEATEAVRRAAADPGADIQT